MDVTNLRFDIDGFDGGIESRRAGDRIEIAYQGLIVMAFDVNDLTARDWTIASLLETSLKGKAVAQLCHTSPAQVSLVRKHLRSGGYDALRHGELGAKKKLVGAALSRAIELRRQGATVRDIGYELGVSSSTATLAVQGIPRGNRSHQEQKVLEEQAEPRETLAKEAPSETPNAPAAPPAAFEPESIIGANDTVSELVPGEPLPAGPAEHDCRYAGTLLIIAAAQVLGLFRGLNAADVHRPEKSVYPASQAVVALVSAWAAGFVSLEAMHERDARALGVVLGLERSPSVRTLHRAIAQMVRVFSPIAFGSALLQGLIAALGKVPRVFGVDGHFKPYFGKEPIDKGWNTKRRMATRGLADVLVHDEQGRIWLGLNVGAGESLHEHVGAAARRLRQELGDEEQLVLAFDRGGFSFEVLEGLNDDGFCYVAWVPWSVSLPELSTIAPSDDGVGEQRWLHSRLGDHHRARLLVERDGDSLLPVVTNLSAEVSANEALELLRKVRGAQENDIKAARAFAHIDRLVDRGGARRAPDDRQVDNPVHRELSQRRRKTQDALQEIQNRVPRSKQERANKAGDCLLAELEDALLTHLMNDVPSKVPRCALEPAAQRAWLKTKNRSLLQQLKYLMANSRRWLLSLLGPALAPSDADWDMTAMPRTLEALICAPGTVQFGIDEVVVTLDLPLPPQPHERLARGLSKLQQHEMLFSDGRRRVDFRLAPRPTRASLPSNAAD